MAVNGDAAGRIGRTEARRQVILDAALDRFVEQGYGQATIADICARAGVSVGSVYHHFDSKEHIAVTLYADSLREYQAGVLEIVRGASGAEEGISEVVRFHLRWLGEHPIKAVFLLSHDGEAGFARLASSGSVRHNRRFLRAIGRWFDEQVAAGQVRPLPLGVATALWTGPAQEWARRWVAGGRRDDLLGASAHLAVGAWEALRVRPPVLADEPV